MDLFTVIDNEYYIGVTEYVLYVLSKINGPIPTFVAQADAHNGLLTRLGSTQVLETTIKNAQNIIHGTPEQRRMAQEALNHVESQNQDITREEIRDHRTFVPPPDFQPSAEPPSQSRNVEDPEITKLRLKTEAEMHKKECLQIKKAMDDNQRIEREQRNNLKKEEAEYFHLQEMKKMEVREEEARIKKDIEKEKEKTKLERIYNSQESNRAKQEENKAKQEENKAKQEEHKAAQETSRFKYAEEETRRAIALKKLEQEHEMRMKGLSEPSFLNPNPNPNTFQTNTTQASSSSSSVIQSDPESKKVHVSSVSQFIRYFLFRLVEPTKHYGAKLSGLGMAYQLLAASIYVRKIGNVDFFPSLNLAEREFDIKHYCAELKRIWQDLNRAIHVTDRPPHTIEYDDNGRVVSHDRTEPDFFLLGYEYRGPLLYTGEYKIEVFGSTMGYDLDITRLTNSGRIKKIVVKSRPDFDKGWGNTLDNWYRAYQANPLTPPRKVKRVKFSGVQSDEE